MCSEPDLCGRCDECRNCGCQCEKGALRKENAALRRAKGVAEDLCAAQAQEIEQLREQMATDPFTDRAYAIAARVKAEAALAEAQREIADLRTQISDLLSAIHRNAGLHTKAVGLERSIADARDWVAKAHRQIERRGEPRG